MGRDRGGRGRALRVAPRIEDLTADGVEIGAFAGQSHQDADGAVGRRRGQREHAVGDLIGRSEWTLLSHRIIFHGRRVCHARKPACGVCVLARDCPSFGEGPTDPLLAAPLVNGPETEHLLALAGLQS